MILEHTLRWTVLASIFLLTLIPFFIAQSLFFPFITGKNFAFRILIEVATAGWLALALVYPKYRPRRSLILAAFALFVVIVALADALGAYPFKSFWSNYERMDGWVTLAHLFMLVAVASSMLNTEKLWKTFWQTELVMSLLIAAYSFLQLFGVASLTAGFSSVERLDATFGNPIYLAVYMLFNAFVAALLWVQTWNASTRGSRFGFAFDGTARTHYRLHRRSVYFPRLDRTLRPRFFSPPRSDCARRGSRYHRSLGRILPGA